MRLKIGEFAQVGRISVSTLRYYNDVGLLKPADVDRWTGYRYYTLDQLPMLNRILALKDLGLSLEQISRLVGHELPLDEIRGMLRLKRAELQQQAEELNERLVRVEARIQQIEMEGKMPDYDVILKKVEPVRVAQVRGVVPNMDVIGPTFDHLFDEVLGYVGAHNAGFSGPAIALYYDMPENMENMSVGAAIPTNGPLTESDRVKVETLPGAATVASVVHHGPFATLGQA
jgi:DNA-binding transcriptional MerR regulator